MHADFMDRDQELTTPASRGVSARFRQLTPALCLAILLIPASLLAEEAGGRAYGLAPGDRITVTIFGQPELSGDVVIDGGGTITIPLATPIEVKGLTATECQKRIAEQLVADGILRTPAVSVRISELRPLYVLGDVRLPGAYPFRYGATTQSAIALAGGYGLGEVPRHTATAEYLQAEEHVRQLTLQNRTLLIRRARLEAERDGKDTFSLPDFANPGDDKDISSIVANETEIFATQRATLRGEIDLLRSQKPILQQQIDANNEEGNAGKKQLDLIQQQISRYGNLLKQGLGLQNNDFQYRVLEANQEAAVWRSLSEVSRLKVETGNLDVKIEEVEATFKRQVATELRETRDRLNELDVALPVATRLRDVKLLYAGGAAAQNAKHLIRITRMRDGQPVVLDANETTPLEPGDVIEIKNETLYIPPRDESAATSLKQGFPITKEAQDERTVSSVSR
jgi:polysaccharide biosynthesis/export protein